MVAASSPFAAVTAMGALIAPAQFARIAAATLPGQDGDAYGVPKGLTLRDELARFFRIGQAQWRTFSAADTPSLGATTRFIEGLLRDVLGYSDIGRLSEQVTVGGRSFPIALMAGAVPIAIAPAADAIDRPSDALSAQGRRRSAATLMQEYLNADAAALWGLACNGRSLRLVRDNPSLTRPAFIEFDLAAIFDDEAYADFAAMFLTLHRSRFATNDDSCLLEQWRTEGAKAGAVARDKLRGGVEEALLLIGQGFLEHPGNAVLAERLRSGTLSLADYYAALLRLVYRLIFLLAAEDRGLLHPADANAAARQLYSRGYALGRLRDRSVRRAAWDRHHDAWDGLCIVMEALGRGEPRLGLPALGGLFDRDSLPDLEAARLSNARLLEAIYRLAWLREASGPAPVNWRDMESEELGSVYEGLLELVPRLERGGTQFTFATEGVETKGNARKVSGSYYTPDSLVQALLDSALNPLLDTTVSGAEDPEAALLALRLVDPACGSGHFLLAAARRIAARLAAVRTRGSPAPDDYRHALREVMGACIHGVDRNPMAVELTKVALWIESVEPGKPLGLLDANIRCGDALLGVDNLGVLEKGIPDGAFAPLTGDDKTSARELRDMNRAERDRPLLSAILRPKRIAGDAARVHEMPEETIAQVEAKRGALANFALSEEYRCLMRAADAWVVAFLAPKRPGATVPTTRAVWEALGGGAKQEPLSRDIDRLARFARVFHWPLEFPAVLANPNSGFDLVIGNPPWEVMQLSEKEYFSQRLPEIAGLPGAARKRAIADLAINSPEIFSEYQQSKRIFDASNVFARESDRFDLTARGKINTYGLFAQLFSRIGRRAGMITPLSLATSDTLSAYFNYIVEKRKLVSLISFDEIKKWFPGSKDNQSFCLVTLGRADRPLFSFRNETVADRYDHRRAFELGQEEIERISPNTRTAPVFRTRADAELTAAIYSRVPVLINDANQQTGNEWGAEFRQGLFNMTSDSDIFRSAAQLLAAGFQDEGRCWVSPISPAGNAEPTRYVPLYEAKMFHQFDHRWGYYPPDAMDDTRALPRPTPEEKADPSFEPAPRHWAPLEAVETQLADKGWARGWLLAWRDITNATNERTAIFGIIPRSAVGHTVPLMFVRGEPSNWASIYANLNSLILDYVMRQKMDGTHLTYSYLKQLPILPRSHYNSGDLDFIASRVLELTYTSASMEPFARDFGFMGAPFAWDDTRRAEIRAELDAWYARAYGLTRDQLRYILDPADVMGADYPSETFRVLKKNDIARFGDYRTARLTLAAWDAQARGA